MVEWMTHLPGKERRLGRRSQRVAAAGIPALILGLILCGPALGGGKAPLEVQEVADGVYVHQGAHKDLGADIANIGFIVGDDGVAVLDTGGSLGTGKRLRAAIREVTDRPIRYVINTHMHPDHVLGNAAFREDDPEVIGHKELPQGLSSRGPTYRRKLGEVLDRTIPEDWIVLPDRTIENSAELDLGGRTLRLEAHPPAHTSNDLTVYDEATETWWLSDLLFLERIPALDGSLKGWLKVLDGLKERQAERVVPGHGPVQADWPSAAGPQQAYLETLLTGIRSAIDKGRTIREAYEEVGWEHQDRWRLFDAYHRRNVSTAYAELEWE